MVRNGNIHKYSLQLESLNLFLADIVHVHASSVKHVCCTITVKTSLSGHLQNKDRFSKSRQNYDVKQEPQN